MTIKELMEQFEPEVQQDFYSAFTRAQDSGDKTALIEFIDKTFATLPEYLDLKEELLEKCGKKESEEEPDDKDKEIDKLKKENDKLKKDMEEKMANESKLFEKGFEDFKSDKVNLDEMISSDDYRKGVEKAKKECSAPDVVIEKKLESFKKELLSELSSLIGKKDEKKVSVADAYKTGLYEGRKGNSSVEFENDNVSIVEAFKEGLTEGLTENEKKIKPLKKLAEKCDVELDEFVDLVLEGKGKEAFETIIESVNESTSSKVDELMEKLVAFANSNGCEFLLSEVKKENDMEDEEKMKVAEKIKKLKREMDDEEDEEEKAKISEKIKKMKKEMDGDKEDDEDEDEEKVSEKKRKMRKESDDEEDEEVKKYEEKIKKLKKEMDDEEDEEKKNKISEKIKKMKKEMATELPKDVEEAIKDMKKGMTLSEQASLDERISELVFEDVAELREQLVELFNVLTEEVKDDKSPEQELINKYSKRFGK